MANDLSALTATVAGLEAKVNETNSTLAGLAAEVVRLTEMLKNLPPDIQADIDALNVRAQAILDGLTAAEDAADDQLPQPPG